MLNKSDCMLLKMCVLKPSSLGRFGKMLPRTQSRGVFMNVLYFVCSSSNYVFCERLFIYCRLKALMIGRRFFS